MTTARGKMAIRHHIEDKEKLREKIATQREEEAAKALALCNGFPMYPKTQRKSNEAMLEIKGRMDNVAYNKQMAEIDAEHDFKPKRKRKSKRKGVK